MHENLNEVNYHITFGMLIIIITGLPLSTLLISILDKASSHLLTFGAHDVILEEPHLRIGNIFHHNLHNPVKDMVFPLPCCHLSIHYLSTFANVFSYRCQSTHPPCMWTCRWKLEWEEYPLLTSSSIWESMHPLVSLPLWVLGNVIPMRLLGSFLNSVSDLPILVSLLI